MKTTKIQLLLKKPITAITLSILIGFLIGGVILTLAGFDPFRAYLALFNGIFSKPKYISQVIIKSTPLILTGLSVAFAFKTGLFNIGAEGQYIIGTIVAVLTGLFLNLPPVIHFFVVIIIASLAAGVWGGIIGLLKAKFGINEVITSIMFNWIAFYLNNYMVSLPWLRKPGADSSFPIKESAWNVVLNSYKTSESGRKALQNSSSPISEMLLKTDMNYGILIAILICLLIFILLKYTKLGFEFRAVGANKDTSEFVGINIKKNIILSMFVSGAIAGIAGALQITGTMPHRIGLLSAQEGYGFDGMSVALIACSSPIGCIFSGLFLGALKYGGGAIQSQVGAPSEIINIVIGVIMFIVAMSSVFKIISGYISKKNKIKFIKIKN
ncbi:MAG: ABC transporter permease [Oscillospiraceae bacterium]|nr:ABC transporter permease [Oscillospiraceae bacterium]